ncbi:hypothetical protein GCM10009838_27590 [Catenulispora subtropica]|uniref:Uncharacterized protein n=1 Tax=Catenulispora subtropica TaxID=450798 RepID=A0ABN2RE83_9ACTN
MAPPNRYVNNTVKMIGTAMTSDSCSGTCLIFSNARQAKTRAAAAGPGRGGRAAGDKALMSCRGSAAVWAGVVVLMSAPGGGQVMAGSVSSGWGCVR